MFEHEKFDRYDFDQIPLDRDIFIVGAEWMHAYEAMMLQFFGGAEYETLGFISWFSVRSISAHAIELSWYVDFSKRLHEIAVTLPRSEFIACVGCWRASERPRIFVTDKWLDHIHLRNYSVFGLIDAIGIRQQMETGTLTQNRLLLLRSRIDDIALRHPDVAFVSFGDSVLIKSNWTVGMFSADVSYTYSPEMMIPLFQSIACAYAEVLGARIYGIFTQGTNEYYGSAALHQSEQGNHICMNSLGIPFERLFAIDDTVRRSIRDGRHGPSELYLDDEFLRSLQLPYDFRSTKAAHRFAFRSKMSQTELHYVTANAEEISVNLERESQLAVERRVAIISQQIDE